MTTPRSRGGIDIDALRATSSRTPRSARDVADKKARAELRAAGDSGASKKGGVEREDDLAAYYKQRNAENLAKAKEKKQKELLQDPTASLIQCACSGVARADDLAFLVERNCDLDDIVDGRSPLMAACQYGSQAGVEALVRAGADVDLQNADGISALMIAVTAGHVPIVSFLLDHSGANPSLLDRAGHSALQCAYERGHSTLASKLVRALAAPPAKVTTIAREKMAEGRRKQVEQEKKEREDKKALLARTIAEVKEEAEANK